MVRGWLEGESEGESEGNVTGGQCRLKSRLEGIYIYHSGQVDTGQ